MEKVRRRVAVVTATGVTAATVGGAALGGAKVGAEAWEITYKPQYAAQVKATIDIARLGKANKVLRTEIAAFDTTHRVKKAKKVPIPIIDAKIMSDLNKKVKDNNTTITNDQDQIRNNGTQFSIGEAEATGAGSAEAGLGVISGIVFLRRRRARKEEAKKAAATPGGS